MGFTITASGNQLKYTYRKTFTKAADAVERAEFLTILAGRVEICDHAGQAMTLEQLRRQAQTERDDYC